MDPKIFIYELRRQVEWLEKRRLWGKEVEERYQELKSFMENYAPQGQIEMFKERV